ncbi:hypothetical protein [Streptomyces sp. NPDC002746]
MEQFVPKFRGSAWPSGTGVLHIYALPRKGVEDDLLEMALACNSLAEGYPIDPQYSGTEDDAGLLHMTLEIVADKPTAEYTPADLLMLVNELNRQLADVAPFTTRVGHPYSNVAGVVLDTWPDAEAIGLNDRLRRAIRAARGEAALKHSGGRHHISIGYAVDSANSDELNGPLRNDITPREAEFGIEQVHLLDVTWTFDDELGGWRMSWKPVAVIPLGQATTSTTG